jgi:hypothetical protein
MHPSRFRDITSVLFESKLRIPFHWMTYLIMFIPVCG